MGSSVCDYEVFLSFRGVDTRQGFTAILHYLMTMVEIRVFKDDNELAIGDKIDSILEAINTSKICIPIFSPKFAESKWCLNEVLRMVELKKTIVPIFYEVSPDDVKLKGGSVFSKAFRKLEKNHRNLEQVEKWKKALREAASNKGRTLGEKSYPDFCKELVNEVLSKLGPRKRLKLDYFVGDDNREAAMKLLEMGFLSEEVVCVGIYGMGGIGKTTITKLIYNELLPKFEHCAFLPDIQEFTKSKGIQQLAKYLYDNLEPKPGMLFSRSNQIASIFKNKKVLLILDDVNSYDQIKEVARDPSWFGSGSRILLTTRDKKVVEDYSRESGHEIRHLEMKGLEDGWGLELFCKYAFGRDSPPSPYEKLSKRVLAYSGGLPLTITVAGKSLRNHTSIQVWEEFIEGLKKSPPKEVKEKLMISYESLENEQKTIFLDIACFFTYEYSLIYHHTVADLILMWQASSLLPYMSLQVLQSKSFLKIDENDYIWMHDQLRDMGRDIVRKYSKGDITQQSRLWENNDILEVLKCNEKKNKTKTIQQLREIYNKDDDIHYDFSGFNNLRFLVLGRSYYVWSQSNHVPHKISGTLPKLLWLSLQGDFEVENLVVPNLVVLNINWNIFQDKTPLFIQNMRSIQRLKMDWCSNLASIDPSIVELKHLTSLSLSRCRGVCELPEELGCMRNLIKLDLHKCSNLSIIPESIGNLYSLKELDLQEIRITKLPDSIGRLKKLERLNLMGCTHLISLPETFGNLHSLEMLDLSFTVALTSLPDSVGNLRSLVYLNLLYSNYIRQLPKLHVNLTKLMIRSSALKKVHDLSYLHHLTSLRLEGGDILDWDGSFPTNLRSLCIELLSISRLPNLRNCSELTEFTLQCQTSLKVLPNLSGLRKLERLEIKYCYELIEIPGIGNLQSLTSLCIRGCPYLVSLGRIQQLTRLHTNLREILAEIPELGGLRSLTELVFDNWKYV